MVVGKKSSAVGVMYTLVGLFFVFAMLLAFTQMEGSDRTMVLIFGFVFILIDGIILALYATTPAEAIILNPDKSVFLRKDNVNLSMAEIVDISYKKASARGIQYKWGKVIISTASTRYSVNYISECENVAKYLVNEWYGYRNYMNGGNVPFN